VRSVSNMQNKKSRQKNFYKNASTRKPIIAQQLDLILGWQLDAALQEIQTNIKDLDTLCLEREETLLNRAKSAKRHQIANLNKRISDDIKQEEFLAKRERYCVDKHAYAKELASRFNTLRLKKLLPIWGFVKKYKIDRLTIMGYNKGKFPIKKESLAKLERMFIDIGGVIDFEHLKGNDYVRRKYN